MKFLPESFPYINEPTDFNLQIETPDKYFISGTENVKEHFENTDLVGPFKKNVLGNIIAEIFKRFHITETSKMLDRMKSLGFKYSTRAGITIGMSDIIVLPDKDVILEADTKKVDNVLQQFRRGLITEEERYDRVISYWSAARDVIQVRLMESLDNLNPIYMMSDSGARGNVSNFTQLAGMRGLMVKPGRTNYRTSD